MLSSALLLRRAEEISANLDRMGIEYTPEKIDKLVRDAARKRRIEGVREGPTEFYNDKVPHIAASLFLLWHAGILHAKLARTASSNACTLWFRPASRSVLRSIM
jgi:hypothetical protein